MVDPTCRVNVIMKEALFINGIHRMRYDEHCAFVFTHNGLFLSPLGITILMVFVGPKVVSATFVIPKLNFFCVKLGISWLITMEAVPLVIQKCLKFPHEGTLHVV